MILAFVAPTSKTPALFGQIEVFDSYLDGLRDLDGFQRIWVLYWCHRASTPKLTVVPYRDTVPHGVFATRAPARPNPMGLSTLRLLEVIPTHLSQ
jgi:tRNA-Thr(GGU) m(6)t(6)A37 methyltransferase TsaA